MLTNSHIDLRVLGNEFPDRTLGKSLRAGIAPQWVKGSGENLLSRDWIPVCPVGKISLHQNAPVRQHRTIGSEQRFNVVAVSYSPDATDD